MEHGPAAWFKDQCVLGLYYHLQPVCVLGCCDHSDPAMYGRIVSFLAHTQAALVSRTFL